MENRRTFVKKAALGAAGLSFAMSAKSYAQIIGSNDRLNIAFIGCGRRVPAFYDAAANPENNVRLLYICDVMKSQRERTAADLAEAISNTPKLIEDMRQALEDDSVDAVFHATPDHWHAPGGWMSLEAGKHVYMEKPCSHNPREGELLMKFHERYGKVVQIGTQQRSAPETIEAISAIHNGEIGEPYKAVTFYSNSRGRVPAPQPAAPPAGLNWDLFQGPAPREDYKHDTWDYNWHWYGWKWGTAETGNNATHELDVARWAMKLNYPEKVYAEAAKRHYLDDGWTMYDTMEATFVFPENKVVTWDGKSRNAYKTYGADRGTVIYGTEGSLFVNRQGYKLYDRAGVLMRENMSAGEEAGTALGGGGDMSTLHVENFFQAIRGKATVNAPLSEGVKSALLCHLANIAYRTGETLETNPKDGRITNSKKAMKLWEREYEKGWEPKT